MHEVGVSSQRLCSSVKNHGISLRRQMINGQKAHVCLALMAPPGEPMHAARYAHFHRVRALRRPRVAWLCIA